MRASLRRDREGLSGLLIVIAIIVVIIVVVLAALFLFGVFSPKPVRLYATADLASGQTVTIADTAAFASGSVVTYNGQVVTAFHFYTTFTGTSSSGYTQYTLSSNAVGTFTMTQQLSRCQQISLSAQVTRSPPSPFTMGTTYNLGTYATTGSGTPASVLDVTASSIISWSVLCAGNANYNLVYSISLTAQAVGAGTLPTSTWSGSITLGIAVTTGSMSLTGSNSGVP